MFINVTGECDVFSTIQMTTALSKAAVSIIADYYSEHTSNVFIISGSIGKESSINQSDAINDIVRNAQVEIAFIIVHAEHIHYAQHLRYWNFLFDDGYNDFR